MDANLEFDKNWTLHPINGDTGQSYMGVNESGKVFIKKNSSPFLAALSREEIAPRLVWTRRTGNGDVLIAQEWVEGRLLTNNEVGNRLDVIRILHHVHHSDSLKNMLVRLGGEKKSAFDFLSDYANGLPNELKQNQYLLRVFRYLEDHLPSSTGVQACHGDPTSNNWLLSEEGRLYLVDWDSTVLADPALDLGIILGRYVAFEDWSQWLSSYGVSPNPANIERIYWYSGMDFLQRIKQYQLKYDLKGMNQEILLLKQIYAY